jgi:S-DNA-T family DNA segregation ATPase FtsK/SpoIIIE
MKLLSPTQHRRLNEVTGFLLLFMGLVTLLSLVSYYAQDPSWDTASDARPLNLVGYPGSYLSDLLFQSFGAAAFLFPLLTFLLAWRWIRSEELQAGAVKIFGSVLLTTGVCTALSFAPLRLYGGTVRIGGTVGLAFATWLVDSLNIAGAVLATLTAVIVAVYLVSTFTISKLADWFAPPAAWFRRRLIALRGWSERLRQKSLEKARLKSL